MLCQIYKIVNYALGFAAFFQKRIVNYELMLYLCSVKRKILLIIISLLGCISAHAIPVKPGVKYTITLADGQQIETMLCGDEFYRYYVADDGSVYQQKGKQFERISLEEAQNEWKSSMARARKMHKRKTRGDDDEYYFDMTGKRKGLVLLMQFPDVKFSSDNPHDVFYDFFNKENYTENGMTGSVKDYFKAQSYGQLELEFDVVGPFTAPDSSAYYGENTKSVSARLPELVYQGCLMADSLVNFADYDWNGDGEVEQVFIVYAGYSEASSGNPDDIWPHKWNISYYGLSLILDGVEICQYACANELYGSETNVLNGIGAACHEFSHCLGLEDMYNVNNAEVCGMCKWDVMDQGCYNNYSRTPAGYTSFERWCLEWIEPIELLDSTQISEMRPLTEVPEIYVIYNDANDNEYYLLENRQMRGFDSALPGHGLLIIHVDFDEEAWYTSKFNIDPDHQRCTVIAADNDYTKASQDGDPYPGTTNNTSLSNYTTPAATLFNENIEGTKFLNITIDNITESDDGLISFRFLPWPLPKSDSSGISCASLLQAPSQNIYNLQGRQMGTNLNTLPPGIYILNGQKVVK